MTIPLKERIGLFKALMVAGWYSNLLKADSWVKFWFALKGLLGWIDKEEAASDLARETRLNICPNCPLYYAPLETCGSPFSDYPNLGCWCYLPVAARFAAKRCWLDETFPHGDHNGWRKAGVGR